MEPVRCHGRKHTYFTKPCVRLTLSRRTTNLDTFATYSSLLATYKTDMRFIKKDMFYRLVPHLTKVRCEIDKTAKQCHDYNSYNSIAHSLFLPYVWAQSVNLHYDESTFLDCFQIRFIPLLLLILTNFCIQARTSALSICLSWHIPA